MLPRPALYGEPGRVPFLGHLRVVREGNAASWGAAGRLREPVEVLPAYHLARAVEGALALAWEALPADADRFDGLRAAWGALRELHARSGGLAGRLELLLLGVDGEGRAVAGTGLARVWELDEAGARVLTGADHPLAAEADWLTELPGVLQLPRGSGALLGVREAHSEAGPGDADWTRRCGRRIS